MNFSEVVKERQRPRCVLVKAKNRWRRHTAAEGVQLTVVNGVTDTPDAAKRRYKSGIGYTICERTGRGLPAPNGVAHLGAANCLAAAMRKNPSVAVR